ncbi:unnamed protein product [Cuscuta campestris]|uniref:Retrotransposon gag domain-containing protein n=1 Tax=Cuscuta campestris TaxID=132261 RepID=A0A484KQZ1_9ASTE|nr:unnamed protein product [Cuscuta campestris]
MRGADKRRQKVFWQKNKRPLNGLGRWFDSSLNQHNQIPQKVHQAKTALSANLLLGWIDGHEAAPAPTISKNDKTVPNPEYTSWTIVDTQIRACLLAVISPSVHKHARGFTTSAALWDALAARYNSVSTAHVYQLRDKLHTLRKGTKTMTQYLDDVATILSDLDALKEEIPERDVVNAVIRESEWLRALI